MDDEPRELDATMVAALLNLSTTVEDLRAELAATKMALGVAIVHGSQSATVQLRGLVGQADDVTLGLQMTERQRVVYLQHLQGIAKGVELSQAVLHPGGLRGVIVACARWWLNLRRVLVGVHWSGGIVRGLAMRWWTGGPARTSSRVARDAALANARSGLS